jgi:hypothetical protein
MVHGAAARSLCDWVIQVLALQASHKPQHRKVSREDAPARRGRGFQVLASQHGERSPVRPPDYGFVFVAHSSPTASYMAPGSRRPFLVAIEAVVLSAGMGVVYFMHVGRAAANTHDICSPVELVA